MSAKIPTATQGIIPARAGFTQTGLIEAREYKDHPRSRGVYRFTRGVVVEYAGSSPLARGLPPVCRLSVNQSGIIPARAGFTCRRQHPARQPQDHPRSRGVYWNPP